VNTNKESGAAMAQPELDTVHLKPGAAQALLRLVEAAPDVRRRYQFFTWLQGQVNPLLPHTVALCGAYNRTRRQLVFDVFHAVPLAQAALLQLSAPESPLLGHLSQAWVLNEGRPLVKTLSEVAKRVPGAECEGLSAAGVERLLVHGVALPDRAQEIVTLFVLAGPGGVGDDTTAMVQRLLDLAVHPLHAALLRTLSLEREMGVQPMRALPMQAQRTPRVTAREAQILSWVRAGMNNQQIGVELGISALTVKNHVQKILRKLGASNRAHAVALAMQWRLLSEDNVPSGFSALGGPENT
jgi:transcriptional regulator EpsA